MATWHHDPEWPRSHSWLAGEFSVGAPRLAVLGLPSRLGSISPGRCDLAPDAIRHELGRLSTYDIVNNVDLRDLSVIDAGNVDIHDLSIEQAFSMSHHAVEKALEGREAIVILGGDNAVTRPGVHGLGVPLDRCGVVTLDAHLDLRRLDEGLTNGNPIRALLADGLPGNNIVQIGIQSFANSKAYFEVARNEGISVVTMDEVHSRGIVEILAERIKSLAERVEVIYFDLDLDVMDRSFAPGTPGSRPGGLAPSELLQAARWMGAHPAVRAMDLVELDPELDQSSVTSLSAAMCLTAFASGLASRS